MEAVLDMNAMLSPIPGDNPSGADLSFSNEFDEIKEARRAEDDLPQDQWETKLKTAEWPKVKRLASELLATRTKDLQLAAWLTESLTQLHGFGGLFAGLSVTQELLNNFWDTLHPSVVDGISVRGGKIAWINSHLPGVIVSVPVTTAAAGNFGLRHWNQAKEIENVARRDPAAARRLEEEGRISSEVIDKAIAETPGAFYKSLYEDVTACHGAVLALDQVVESKFAGEAPSLSALKGAVEQCVQLITRLSRSKGVLVDENIPELTQDAQTGGVATTSVASAPAGSRQEALRKLTEAAQYFRVHEPHSPVAYLVDRAVRWGGMSFDRWLEEVVKDPGQLQSLYELLGIKQDQGS